MIRPTATMTPLVSVSRRQILVGALAGTGAMSLLLSAATGAPARAAAPVNDTLPTGDVHDFDFFVGTWNIVNRRLKKRWVGSDDWDVFPATFRSENRLGGVVNIDEGVFPTKGWSGVTLRTFVLEKRQWFIYWINSRSGELNPPMVGGFSGDRGEFHGDDTDDGRPIKARFLYTRQGNDALRWEQAFSVDGKQWETNWIMDHTRAKG